MNSDLIFISPNSPHREGLGEMKIRSEFMDLAGKITLEIECSSLNLLWECPVHIFKTVLQHNEPVLEKMLMQGLATKYLIQAGINQAATQSNASLYKTQLETIEQQIRDLSIILSDVVQQYQHVQTKAKENSLVNQAILQEKKRKKNS